MNNTIGSTDRSAGVVPSNRSPWVRFPAEYERTGVRDARKNGCCHMIREFCPSDAVGSFCMAVTCQAPGIPIVPAPIYAAPRPVYDDATKPAIPPGGLPRIA
jgi:hypothetical protein